MWRDYRCCAVKDRNVTTVMRLNACQLQETQLIVRPYLPSSGSLATCTKWKDGYYVEDTCFLWVSHGPSSVSWSGWLWLHKLELHSLAGEEIRGCWKIKEKVLKPRRPPRRAVVWTESSHSPAHFSEGNLFSTVGLPLYMEPGCSEMPRDEEQALENMWLVRSLS